MPSDKAAHRLQNGQYEFIWRTQKIRCKKTAQLKMWYISKQRIFKREMTDSQETLREMFNTLKASGNYNSKPLWDFTLYQSEQPRESSDSSCWRGWGARECMLVQPLCKSMLELLRKLGINVSLRQILKGHYRATWSTMFTATVFIAARIGNSLDVHQWMNR